MKIEYCCKKAKDSHILSYMNEYWHLSSCEASEEIKFCPFCGTRLEKKFVSVP